MTIKCLQCSTHECNYLLPAARWRHHGADKNSSVQSESDAGLIAAHTDLLCIPTRTKHSDKRWVENDGASGDLWVINVCLKWIWLPAGGPRGAAAGPTESLRLHQPVKLHFGNWQILHSPSEWRFSISFVQGGDLNQDGGFDSISVAAGRHALHRHGLNYQIHR